MTKRDPAAVQGDPADPTEERVDALEEHADAQVEHADTPDEQVDATEEQMDAPDEHEDAPEAQADTTPEPADVEDTPQEPVEGRAAWRRLLGMGGPRPTRANVLIALLAILLGAAIAAQVQLTNSRGLDELSQSDLVRVLDDISVRSSRLDQQVRELEATRDRLKNGTGDTAEAIAQAEKRVDTLGILAGLLPAQGPGIRVTISDPDRQLTGPIVLDLVQELRDAGAEAIDIGGVRVVASTFIGTEDGTILVDGHRIARPIEVAAIGDSKTLSSAMTIPGGVVETVRQKGGTAAVAEVDDVKITSVHEPLPLTHATPGE